MNSFSNDTTAITFFDLKRLFWRHRRWILRAALLCAFAMLSMLLLKSPVYRAEASFKQAGRQSDISMNMKEIFQQILPAQVEGGTLAIMRSNEMLRDVAETLGLQMHCNPDFLLLKIFKRIWENVYCELTGSLSDLDSFRFCDVSYYGEKPLRFFLKFADKENFQIFNSEKKWLADGKVGQPVLLHEVHFTLKHIPKNTKLVKFYPLTVAPWFQTVAFIRKNLDVRPLKLDKNILELSYLSRDRHLAAVTLNQVMRSYQKYLKKENEELYQSQLAYLQNRQEQLIGQFDQALSEHVAYLMENLGKNGFIGFAQELETLSEPKNLYISKLFDIDVELKRFLFAKDSLSLPICGNESKYDDAKNNATYEKERIQTTPFNQLLKENFQEREALDLEQRKMQTASFQPLVIEIQHTERQIDEAKNILCSLEKGGGNLSFLSDPKSAISGLIKQILLAQSYFDEKEPGKPQVITVLKSAIQQLELKRKMLNEDLDLQNKESHDFAGLSLETAQRLLIEYTQQRDKIQAEMKELLYLRECLANPDFELSSLGTVIDEPVTNELIQKASSIALQLQDDGNRSEREQERLLQSLKTQKSFLSQYIFQTVELKKLRIQLFEDKIASLHRNIVGLLESEKSLLSQKLHEINIKMGDLPDKWRRESLLLLKKEIGSMMIHAISQLTENKFLGANIFQVTSKPLDAAFSAQKPKAPKLLFFTLLSAFLGAAGCYFLFLCRALLRGIPVSYDNLKLAGFPVSGAFSSNGRQTLSQLSGGDLETLRRVAEFISSQPMCSDALTVVGIGGKYPDYSKSLAEILALRGSKVLIIQSVCDPVHSSEQASGLWQYLSGEAETVSIDHGLFDYLPAGRAHRNGVELMQSPKFAQLLTELKQKYDVILLFTNAEASKAEAVAYLKLAEAALITVQQERKEDLFIYTEWSQKKGVHCTNFIYAEEFTPKKTGFKPWSKRFPFTLFG